MWRFKNDRLASAQLQACVKSLHSTRLFCLDLVSQWWIEFRQDTRSHYLLS